MALLAITGVAAGAFSAAVVVVTLGLWYWSRPPVLSSASLAPVLRRGLYWWLGATCAFGFAAVAWVMLRRPLGLPRQGVFRVLPLALGLAPLLVVNPLYLWRTWWVRRALAASGGRLCTHCAYNLSGLPAAGTCPECGRPYDVDADKPLWDALTARAARTQTPEAAAPDRSGRDAG